MIKSRHDTAFFQRSYSSGLDHGTQYLIFLDLVIKSRGDISRFFNLTFLHYSNDYVI
ncbi:hypothetical protein [Rickettsia endosymbiont of Orchestes rusci]|uniref:hypothetical protein n=1 Tax=Rickettsia endosymbiont of Orchestes rusci TaxID=3066250 RepID=UPI00313B327E